MQVVGIDGLRPCFLIADVWPLTTHRTANLGRQVLQQKRSLPVFSRLVERGRIRELIAILIEQIALFLHYLVVRILPCLVETAAVACSIGLCITEGTA